MWTWLPAQGSGSWRNQLDNPSASSANAGGTAVLAYGNMRELCLGVEVVLPTGEILDDLRKLRKDNTGYDLKNLFVGAEGTLGVITAAVQKLVPAPKGREVAWAGVSSAGSAVASRCSLLVLRQYSPVSRSDSSQWPGG